MWNYEKRLQYPISISTPNAKMASFIISQYGGPDGEMGASMRYLAQRFSFANPRIAGVLTDTAGVWPQAAGGVPFSATEFQSSGDAIADLVEDMAAEQKARKTYDNILRLAKDQEVADPIRFLREREIVHFQRFGEALRLLQEELDSKNYYAFNPNFDCMQNTTR